MLSIAVCRVLTQTIFIIERSPTTPIPVPIQVCSHRSNQQSNPQASSQKPTYIQSIISTFQIPYTNPYSMRPQSTNPHHITSHIPKFWFMVFVVDKRGDCGLWSHGIWLGLWLGLWLWSRVFLVCGLVYGEDS